MRSEVWQILFASLLLVGLSSAQGGPPKPGRVDPLAANPWNPQPWDPNHAGQPGKAPPGTPFGVQPGTGAPGGMPGGPQPGGMPGGLQPGGMAPGGQPANPPSQGSLGGGAGGAGELQPESNFAGAPTKAAMYTYVPKSFKKGNPVVVALHHCGGTASLYFHEYPDWSKAADQKGFMMVYGDSPGGNGQCWDASSKASLSRDGGGDSQTIANMVKYAQTKYGCSEHQVYLVGHSSGAMLSQVLAATYPDLFIAVAAYSGVPAGCFRTDAATGAGWNVDCAHGKVDESPQYWGQQAKAMYPAFKGTYPRMMLVHGKQDALINFNDQIQAIKQWTYLSNQNPDNPTKKYTLPSQPNYEVSVYGTAVMAIAAEGVTHSNPPKVDETCTFFGL